MSSAPRPNEHRLAIASARLAILFKSIIGPGLPFQYGEANNNKFFARKTNSPPPPTNQPARNGFICGAAAANRPDLEPADCCHVSEPFGLRSLCVAGARQVAGRLSALGLSRPAGEAAAGCRFAAELVRLAGGSSDRSDRRRPRRVGNFRARAVTWQLAPRSTRAGSNEISPSLLPAEVESRSLLSAAQRRADSSGGPGPARSSGL